MNKAVKIILLVLGLLAAAALAWAALAAYLFTGPGPAAPEPLPSPGGTRLAVSSITGRDDPGGYPLVRVAVVDARTGETLFTARSRASNRMRWWLAWQGEDFLRLDSSDIGPTCWQAVRSDWGEVPCPVGDG